MQGSVIDKLFHESLSTPWDKPPIGELVKLILQPIKAGGWSSLQY